MARTPAIRYFDSREGYYTQIRGKQHRLAEGPKDEPEGPIYKAAVAEFSRLTQQAEGDRTNDDTTFGMLLARYKGHLEQHGRLSSLSMVACRLDSAAEHFGTTRIRDLKPFHVQAWLDAMRKPRGRHRGREMVWGDTMTRTAAESLVGVLKWGKKQGLISSVPIGTQSLEVPDIRQRGRDYVLPPGEHALMMGGANECLGNLLRLLHGTGCRPGEAYHATARNYDPERKALVFRWDAQAPDYRHKTARKTKRDRVIYLDNELNGLVVRLVARHPDGPLFRNTRGRRWTNSSVALALKKMRRRLKLTGKMIAYSYRHTFATRWLLEGGSIKILADLMGNSVTMIERHYGHLDAAPEAMRQLLVEFTRKRSASGATQPASAGEGQPA